MGHTTSSRPAWHRPVWLGLLVAISAALTTWFACVTPFVAFSVIAATTPTRRDALFVSVASWLANQAVGYGALHYPWTTNSIAWGAAIGVAALVGTFVAQWSVARLQRLRPSLQALAAFVSAFVVYESALYAVAVSALGGTRGFALSIVSRVLVINAVTLLGLYGLTQLAGVVGVVARRAGRVSSATIRVES